MDQVGPPYQPCPQAYSKAPRSSSLVLTCLLVICVLHFSGVDVNRPSHWIRGIGRMRLTGCQVRQTVMIDRIIDLKPKCIGSLTKELGLISGARTAYSADQLSPLV